MSGELKCLFEQVELKSGRFGVAVHGEVIVSCETEEQASEIAMDFNLAATDAAEKNAGSLFYLDDDFDDLDPEVF